MLIMLIGRIVLKNLMTIGDKLLIFFITATVGIMFYKTYFNTSSNQEVVVSISGNPVRMFSHDELFGNGIYRIPLKNGEARIEIDRGRVRILPMPKKLCPRRICSSIGWIKRSGEAAICVPNRLIVEIRGQDKINTIDSVTR